MSKKTRSDAFESQLTELQFLHLRDGLLDRTLGSYQEAISWLAAECGVSSSSAALSRFWREHCAPVKSERRKMAAIAAEQVGDEMRKDPIDWDAATIERASQWTFELVDERKADPGELYMLLKTLLQKEKQEDDREKLELDRAKFELLKEKEKAAAKAKAQLNDVVKKSKGGITPETLKRIEEAANLL